MDPTCFPFFLSTQQTSPCSLPCSCETLSLRKVSSWDRQWQWVKARSVASSLCSCPLRVEVAQDGRSPLTNAPPTTLDCTFYEGTI